MTQHTHKVHFIAGLSNGSTAVEGKGDFAVVEGALSPWQRLLSFCEENNVHITSLALATASGLRWSLPSAGKNPKFAAFAVASKPESYRFFRKAGMDMNSAGQQVAEQRFAVIEATYDDGRTLQLWVDEAYLTSWSLIN